ncbi:hypothetical protein FYC62_02220 [Pedobacter aquae]|uniref:PorT family protein n=1 Tax=Pedobacter aquae TaxID=2605747 RepID=A0A5C0VFG2_9SPHI|nr:DUF6588 family protein [Pedobacter aquae]QEK50613.1 hypothetical protein FYC62_02220 [Pedobacter aquae]
MVKIAHFSKKIALTLSILSVSAASFAQDDIGAIVKAGTGDATKLAQAYLNPFFRGFGFGMNSGWFNSAKTKNLGKFDLRIQATGAFVPPAEQRFDVTKLGLSSSTRLKPGQNKLTPTLFGDDNAGSILQILDDNGIPIEEFQMPEGTGFNIAPSPQVQLTVGLIKNTDVSVRFVPSTKLGDGGQINSWGVGIKKEITSFLPGKSEKIIPVDISLAFGYNQVNVDYKFAIEDQINEGPNPNADLNQRIESKLSGFTVDAILSKKLAVFTPFVSVGYNTAKTELGILGDYIIKSGLGQNDTETIKDPVVINEKSISGMRAGVGFSLHLAIFRLYGAYNIGEYNAVTAGIGFGIGK